MRSSLTDDDDSNHPKRTWVIGAGVLGLLVGVPLLIAWLSGNSELARFASWRGKTNASASLVLASSALIALARRRDSVARWLGGGASLVGVLTFLEYALGVNFGIDELLVRDRHFAEGARFPNRMSPNAAVSFALVGVAIVLANSRARRAAFAAHVLAFCVFVLSSVALIGYLYEVSALYKPTPFIRISPYIAFGLVAVSVGVIGVRPDLGPFAVLASPRLGGYLTRRLLISTVAVPVVLNWLLTQGQRLNWYSESATNALSAVSIASILAGVIIFLGNSLDSVDRKRRQSEHYLRDANQLTAALARASSVDEVVKVTLELGLAALGARSGAVFLLTPDGRALRVLSARGYAKDAVAKYSTIPLDAEVPAAEAVRANEALFISSAEEYRRRYPLIQEADKEPLHAAWAVLPLESRGAKRGAIGLSFEDARNFDPEGRQRITRLAWQCAQALDRALLADSEREARARARAALDAAAIGTYTWDVQSGSVEHDDGTRRIFGFEEGERVHLEDYTARIHPQDVGPWLEALDRCRHEGIDFEKRYRIMLPNGTVRWVLDKGRMTKDHAGVARYLTGAVLDFSNEERAREEAERANRAKDEFLAMLGHELRNPLSPIVTSLQLMKLRAPGQLERERSVIERQVNHMIRLVDDLLDISRITRGRIDLRKVPVELHDVVTQAMEVTTSLFEARRHALRVDVPKSGLLVDGDPARLAQVVSNLLTNAAKYTEPGGKVEIEGRREDSAIVLHVTDSGSGIAPELLPKIFDLFVQGARTIDRSQGGLGLGLSLVRSLVERHGGTVSAESAGPGKGSRFSVRLPALEQSHSEPAVDSKRAPERALGAARRVLVVDDNRDAADTLAEALGQAGHDVRVAYDGPSALSLAAEFEPNIAFLDIGLPVMDGYEVARRLRALRPELPTELVALTGYGQPADRERAREAGFDVHLVKPVALEMALDLARGRARLRQEADARLN